MEEMEHGAADEDGFGDAGGHSGSVELGEAERRLAKLAVLLLGVREPFHQALLVYIFDAAAALARVEKWLFDSAFAPAYPTGVSVVAMSV